MQDLNLNVIMYYARKDQSSADRARGNEVRKLKNNIEYLLQSWELSTLVVTVLVARQTYQWEITQTTLREQNPGQFITLLHVNKD